MIRFYSGGGAGDFQRIEQPFTATEWDRIKGSALRLLRAKQRDDAAELFETIPFQLYEGSNFFNDEFQVLYCDVNHERYVELTELAGDEETARSIKAIVKVLDDIGHAVRHVAVGVDSDSGSAPVAQPDPKITSDTVERALADAERLNSRGGAVSAVDRVHTAFHGYLMEVCRESRIAFADDSDITALFGLLRQHHSAFSGTIPGGDQITQVLRGMAKIVDALNLVRNRRSLAHPNTVLLEEPEAMLVINATRTLLHYLNGKLTSARPRQSALKKLPF